MKTRWLIIGSLTLLLVLYAIFRIYTIRDFNTRMANLNKEIEDLEQITKEIEQLNKDLLDLTDQLNTQAQGDEELKKRLDSANLVVVGRVMAIQPFPNAIAIEQDPNWQTASIKVSLGLKGFGQISPRSDGTILIYFPDSWDTDWAKYPKFEKDQEGIWILRYQRNEQRTRDGTRLFAALVTSEPMDFQPLKNLEKIKKLLE